MNISFIILIAFVQCLFSINADGVDLGLFNLLEALTQKVEVISQNLEAMAKNQIATNEHVKAIAQNMQKFENNLHDMHNFGNDRIIALEHTGKPLLIG